MAQHARGRKQKEEVGFSKTSLETAINCFK